MAAADDTRTTEPPFFMYFPAARTVAKAVVSEASTVAWYWGFAG
jgi:hypothetical protein